MGSNFKLYLYFIALTFSLLLVSCANRGVGPTGGPKDLTPPLLVRSEPQSRQMNVKTKQINLYFNKLVQLINASDKVVISPAQLKPATIKAIGKRVSVLLNDSLKANTTYTIDFADAIADIKEKNLLKNFAFSFSTGAMIDTMEVSGVVLDARTLDPQPNVLAGIHHNLSDSAFTHFPLSRVGKTNEKGRFVVRGIKNGDYRIYALNDANNNYYFDQPVEGIAYQETPIHTTFKMDARSDTVRTDSAKIDTIRQIPYIRYLPDSIILRYFKEDFIHQRFLKSERLQQDKFILYFNAPNDTLPTLKPLNFKWKKSPLVQRSIAGDTITYWLRDTVATKMDTLKMALYYHKSDSIGRLVPALDTLSLRFHHYIKKGLSSNKKPLLKKTKEPVKPTVETIRINSDVQQTWDVNKPIHFNFDVPISQVDSSCIHLLYKVDTLWKPLPVNLSCRDGIGLSYTLRHKWQPEQQYEVDIDSAAFVNIHGVCSDKYSQAFRIRSLEEYSSLIINLSPYMEHAVLELLDNKDVVVRTLKAKPTQNTFEFLMPGDYYLRLYVDSNENGKWDTGNFKQKRQPEMVYYFPLKITLRANWDIEEDWDPTAIPLDKQKPKELIKKIDQTKH